MSATPQTLFPMMGPGDTNTFELVSCQQGCVTSNMAPALIMVRCTPPTAGPHVAGFAIETIAGGDITTSTLTCNGTGMATPMGADAGVTGDGGDVAGPDAGAGGAGGGNGLGERQGFYDCSATALAGGLPVVVALAILARRRSSVR